MKWFFDIWFPLATTERDVAVEQEMKVLELKIVTSYGLAFWPAFGKASLAKRIYT